MIRANGHRYNLSVIETKVPEIVEELVLGSVKVLDVVKRSVLFIVFVVPNSLAYVVI